MPVEKSHVHNRELQHIACVNLFTYYVLGKMVHKKLKGGHLLCEFQGTTLQYIQKICFSVGCYNSVSLSLCTHSLYTAAKDSLLDKVYTSPDSQSHENFDRLLTKSIFSYWKLLPPL